MKNKLIILLLIAITSGFFVSCDKQVYTGATASTEIESGKIYINSNPNGMKIYIDNRNMGVTTPDSVYYLSAGLHTVSLKHDLYLDTTFTVNVEYSSVQTKLVDLTRNPKFYSTVFCTTQPNASKIYLNGNYTGLNTPSKLLKLVPGKYAVKFTKNLCREDSVLLSLKSNDYVEINKTLEDTSISVSYRTSNSKIKSNLITKVIVDKQNKIWFGTLDKGIFTFDGKNWKSLENEVTLGSSHVTDILLDSKGRVWVGTIRGLSILDVGVWTSYDSHLPSLNVSALKEDLSGNIWIGTDKGLVKYDNSVFTILNKSNSGIRDDNITSITVSPSNQVWVGTVNAHVQQYIQFNGTWIEHGIGQFDPQMSPFITALNFDPSGQLWAYHLGNPLDGTKSATLRYNGVVWAYSALPLQFPVEIVSFYNNKDIMWVCTKQGLVKVYSPISAVLYNTIDYSFYSKECNSVCVDQNEDVWIGTNGGGLIKIKKGHY